MAQPGVSNAIVLVTKSVAEGRSISTLFADINVTVFVTNSALGAAEFVLSGVTRSVVVDVDEISPRNWGSFAELRRGNNHVTVLGFSRKSGPSIQTEKSFQGFIQSKKLDTAFAKKVIAEAASLSNAANPLNQRRQKTVPNNVRTLVVAANTLASYAAKRTSPSRVAKLWLATRSLSGAPQDLLDPIWVSRRDGRLELDPTVRPYKALESAMQSWVFRFVEACNIEDEHFLRDASNSCPDALSVLGLAEKAA